MDDPTATDLPALAPGDVYIYSHANGALFLMGADGRSRLVPLAEAAAVAADCHAASRRVVLGWDEAPLAREAVDQITSGGVPVTVHEPSRPPHSWGEGTDALMEAAARGADPILDDLIERGAPVDALDHSGSAALHHAAARGNLHAIRALASAGADLDRVNDRGLTPHMLAMSTGESEAARLLASLGADADGHLETVRFGPSHYGVLHYWLVVALGLLATLVAALWPISPPDLVVVAVVALLYASVMPPRAFWAGGVPRRLDGTALEVRTLWGRRRVIDLRDVTAAAVTGNPTRSGVFGARWLLLAHPDGAPVDQRALRRLRVPPAEVEGVAEHISRVVVVTVGAGKGDEVVVPVGNVLSGRGVLQSTSLRQQLGEARRRRDRVSDR